MAQNIKITSLVDVELKQGKVDTSKLYVGFAKTLEQAIAKVPGGQAILSPDIKVDPKFDTKKALKAFDAILTDPQIKGAKNFGEVEKAVLKYARALEYVDKLSSSSAKGTSNQWKEFSKVLDQIAKQFVNINDVSTKGTARQIASVQTKIARREDKLREFKESPLNSELPVPQQERAKKRLQKELVKLHDELSSLQVKVPLGASVLPELAAQVAKVKELAAAEDKLNKQRQAEGKRQQSPAVQKTKVEEEKRLALVERGNLVRAAIPNAYDTPQHDIPARVAALKDGLVKAEAEMAAAFKKHGSAAHPEFVKASEGAQRFRDELTQVNSVAKNAHPIFRQLGALLAQFSRYAIGYAALYKATQGVQALGAAVVDLEDKLKGIQAITGATDTAMETLSASVKQVAKSTAFSFNEISDAVKVIAQAGVALKDIPATTQAVANLATATGTSLQVAADVITTTKEIWDDVDVETIGDRISQAANVSKLAVEDLQTILSLEGASAKQANISLEQNLALISTLRNAGIKGSTIATGSRQLQTELFSPDKKFADFLQAQYKKIGEDKTGTQAAKVFSDFLLSDNPMLAALQELVRIGATNHEDSVRLARALDTRSLAVLRPLLDNVGKLPEQQARLVTAPTSFEAAQVAMRSFKKSLDNLGDSLISLTNTVVAEGGTLEALQSATKSITNFVHLLDEWLGQANDKGGPFGGNLVPGILATLAGALGASRGVGLLGKAGKALGYGAVAGAVTTATNTTAKNFGLPDAVTAVGDLAIAGYVVSGFKKVKDYFTKKKGFIPAVSDAAESGSAEAATGIAAWAKKQFAHLKGFLVRVTPAALVSPTAAGLGILGGIAAITYFFKSVFDKQSERIRANADAGQGFFESRFNAFKETYLPTQSGSSPTPKELAGSQAERRAANEEAAQGLKPFRGLEPGKAPDTGTLSGLVSVTNAKIADLRQKVSAAIGRELGKDTDQATLELVEAIRLHGTQEGPERQALVKQLTDKLGGTQQVSKEVVAELVQVSGEVVGVASSQLKEMVSTYSQLLANKPKEGSLDDAKLTALKALQQDDPAFRAALDGVTASVPASLQAISKYAVLVRKFSTASASAFGNGVKDIDEQIRALIASTEEDKTSHRIRLAELIKSGLEDHGLLFAKAVIDQTGQALAEETRAGRVKTALQQGNAGQAEATVRAALAAGQQEFTSKDSQQLQGLVNQLGDLAKSVSERPTTTFDEAYSIILGQESAGEARKPGGPAAAVSRTGALGAGQVQPSTLTAYTSVPANILALETKAKAERRRQDDLGLSQPTLSPGERGTLKKFALENKSAIEQASRDYFKSLVNQFDGDLVKATAAYNTGPGRVKKAVALAEQQGSPNFEDFFAIGGKGGLTQATFNEVNAYTKAARASLSAGVSPEDQKSVTDALSGVSALQALAQKINDLPLADLVKENGQTLIKSYAELKSALIDSKTLEIGKETGIGLGPRLAKTQTVADNLAKPPDLEPLVAPVRGAEQRKLETLRDLAATGKQAAYDAGGDPARFIKEGAAKALALNAAERRTYQDDLQKLQGRQEKYGADEESDSRINDLLNSLQDLATKDSEITRSAAKEIDVYLDKKKKEADAHAASQAKSQVRLLDANLASLSKQRDFLEASGDQEAVAAVTGQIVELRQRKYDIEKAALIRAHEAYKGEGDNLAEQDQLETDLLDLKQKRNDDLASFQASDSIRKTAAARIAFLQGIPANAQGLAVLGEGTKATGHNVPASGEALQAYYDQGRLENSGASLSIQAQVQKATRIADELSEQMGVITASSEHLRAQLESGAKTYEQVSAEIQLNNQENFKYAELLGKIRQELEDLNATPLTEFNQISGDSIAAKINNLSSSLKNLNVNIENRVVDAVDNVGSLLSETAIDVAADLLGVGEAADASSAALSDLRNAQLQLNDVVLGSLDVADEITSIRQNETDPQRQEYLIQRALDAQAESEKLARLQVQEAQKAYDDAQFQDSFLGKLAGIGSNFFGGVSQDLIKGASNSLFGGLFGSGQKDGQTKENALLVEDVNGKVGGEGQQGGISKAWDSIIGFFGGGSSNLVGAEDASSGIGNAIGDYFSGTGSQPLGEQTDAALPGLEQFASTAGDAFSDTTDEVSDTLAEQGTTFSGLFGQGGTVSGMFGSLVDSIKGFFGGGGGGGTTSGLISGAGSAASSLASGGARALGASSSSAGAIGGIIGGLASIAGTVYAYEESKDRKRRVIYQAEGGYIQGPGTEKSDSIPAYLSNKEYVLNAETVKKIGKDTLDAWNFGHKQPARFATGGMVGTVRSAVNSRQEPEAKQQPVAPPPAQSIRVVMVDDQRRVGEYMSSAQGERTLIDFVRRNALPIKQVLQG